jgi:hypothetical protein
MIVSTDRALRKGRVEPITKPTGSEDTELSTATRDRLEQELARVREQRHRLAVQLGGEDPDDPSRGPGR